MRSRASSTTGRPAAALALSLVAAACAPPDLPQRPRAAAGTFGEKFFTVACQRVAFTSSLRANQRDPAVPVDLTGQRFRAACRDGFVPANVAPDDAKVAVLLGERTAFVEAIDLIFPGDELAQLQQYMGRILPLTDDGSLPDLVRGLGGAVGEMAADPELTASLARLDRRLGYRPRPLAIGAVREALRYPRLKELLDSVLAVVGPEGKGHTPLLALADGLSQELRAVAPSGDGPLQELLDLLFTQDPAFGSGRAHWIVRRDNRGLAQVRRDPQSGAVPQPFVDDNGDGFADTDVMGGLATRNGGPPPAPFRLAPGSGDRATRDAAGRALDAQGGTLYEYLDLDTTLLAGVAREAVQLLDPLQHTAFDLVAGLDVLIGPRVPGTSAGGGQPAAERVDTARSPLLDVAYAAAQLLRAPQLDDLLDLLREMIADDAGCAGKPACLPRLAARLVGGLLAAKDLGRAHPEAQVAPQSNLYDELLLVARRIAAKPGLLEDLLAAFADPRARQLPELFATLLGHRDIHDFDGAKVVSHHRCSGGSKGAMWCNEVDRSRPDGEHNRSIQQRLLHLISSTNGLRLCNKAGARVTLPAIGISVAGPFDECELFEIDNAAVFFVRAWAKQRGGSGQLSGTPKAHLRLKTENLPGWVAAIVDKVGPDRILELLTGIDGFSSRPDAPAVARLLFTQQLPSTLASVIDPLKDQDGEAIASYHRGTLASWEVPDPSLSCTASAPCTFYGAFAPVVQAFADHQAEDLLVDLLGALHRHWPSPSNERHQFSDPQRPRYAAGSSVATYEPLLVQVLRGTELLPALQAAVPALAAHRLPSGARALDVLVGLVRWVLDPARTPGLTYRDGRTQSRSTDGSYAIEGGVAPIYLLADAWRAAERGLARAEQEDLPIVAAWRRGTSRLADLLLGVDGTGAAARFRNRRALAAARQLLTFAEQRLVRHRARGDLDHWLSRELPADLERLVGGPVLPAAAAVVRELSRDQRALYELSGLCRHLVDEWESPQSFAATITAVADLLQLARDDASLVPLLHQAGQMLSGARGLVAAALRFLQPALAQDRDGDLVKVLRNAYAEHAPGRSAVQTLFDLATELHRQQPGVRTPYTGPDFAEALAQGADFLTNPRTGLQSFFNIVKSRCGGPCPGE